MSGEPVRDEVVGRALREMPVPEHRPSFWADLDRALAAERQPGSGIDSGPASLRAGQSAAPDHRPATGELPVVTRLQAEQGRRQRRAPILAAAAAVVVLAAAVGLVVLAGNTGDGDSDLADGQTESTTSPADGSPGVPATSALPAPFPPVPGDGPAPPPTPDQAVLVWLEGLGGGDFGTSVALTGPRSARYIQSLGPDVTVESYLSELQEGYGGWVDAVDREIAAQTIGSFSQVGGELAIVTVSGTYPGDGGGLRFDVFPVVDTGEGWKVEFQAFDPARENRLTFTVPPETENGLAPISPDAEINVFVGAPGVVFFQIDGSSLETDATSIVAGESFALFDPPGDLAVGPHQLVVMAVGDDGTIVSFGGPLLVEP